MIKAIKYILALTLLCTSQAWAADAPQADRGSVVFVSATSRMQLANDEVVVAYRIEASGVHAALLHTQVNATTERVKAALSTYPALKQQTTGRSLQIMDHYDKALGRQVRDGWRLVQNEQIVGHDLHSVPMWIGSIEQAGAHLDHLGFTVSEAASGAALEKLHMQAIQQFRSKAAAVAKSLDAPSFLILNLRADSGVPPSQVMQRGVMAMSVAESAPTLNSGESSLMVTVSGEIRLPEQSYSVR